MEEVGTVGEKRGRRGMYGEEKKRVMEKRKEKN
jgi:hypothetical protein